MGGQKRYKVGMYDTAYRVTIERPDSAKAELLFGSDDFGEAERAFTAAKHDEGPGTVFLLQRARVISKHEIATEGR